MEKNVKISYDEVEDIFYIGKQEKSKFSIDLALPSGDIVVDIGADGLVKGIEIFNASKFFSIIENELKKVKIADLSIIYSPSYTSISISLDSDKKIVKNSVILPYNKRLATAK